ncbi:MAG: s23 ribosomal protein [uncultured bacterium]|nr:MAG: s23 ribosomal protein [uncultured bacterium]
MSYSFRNLTVWDKGMELAEEIYKITAKFPREEVYGLTSQMRRCAVSVPSNIAEGRQRGSRNEMRQFFSISYGSAGELETQLELAVRLKFIDKTATIRAESLLCEVQKILVTMIKKLNIQN